jgi:type II restriction/modification system DNA methylase subunit YeeA
MSALPVAEPAPPRRLKPEEFIARWRHSPLSERQGAQAFFIDLCDMLGVDRPGSDPDNYTFERGASRTGSGNGWADVWKRNCFAWENKGPHGDLSKALKQLMTYALALDNPPLLVVCDREVIESHTHFTGTPSEVHRIALEEIGRPENQQKLRWLFTEPERFKPQRTVLDVTASAAGHFAEIAQSLASRGHAPTAVAHFLIQCLFCMFSEDVSLLPRGLFARVVEKSAGTPDKLGTRLGELFAAMRTGGEFALEEIAWFNGGLFESITPLPLTTDEALALRDAARMDWSNIEPSIFGTLFERGLDPNLRAQLGAQFTDPGTIMKLIDPTIVQPLTAEWNAAKAVIAAAMEKYRARGKGAAASHKKAQDAFLGFLERLKNFRVLDPACGSGNFLYLALRALKDLEHRANLEAEALGLQRQVSIEVSPANVLGIELNAYAAELARVTVWVGEIQWMLKHGYEIQRRPVLVPLNHIQCGDALLNADGTEAIWPKTNVIVGNPPFLGGSKKRKELGDAYFDRLAQVFSGRLAPAVDLVCYWFEKARTQIVSGQALQAGLVATQSIRGGANRRVLDEITASARIFDAWSDEPWVNDGAAVRVSLVCFGHGQGARLNGEPVATIYANLAAPGESGEDIDVGRAMPLAENFGASFQGASKKAKFEIDATIARGWLCLPNPQGRPNSDVLKPWANGFELSRRPQEQWIIDYGTTMSEAEAALYEAPFEYVVAHVKSERSKNNRETYRKYWWRFAEPRPGLRAAMRDLTRFIATIAHSKHRFFVWLPITTSPDQALITVAREDDVTFGILQSRFHELWALRLGSALEDRPRYTPTTTFETFPFPAGMTPRETISGAPTGPHAAAIAAAAAELNRLREAWLNPPQWVNRVPEVVPGYPDRIVANPGHEAELKKRTLTNLYNAKPTWLVNAHHDLDQAVAKAYGWADYAPEMTDDEILRRLLELNLKRAATK